MDDRNQLPRSAVAPVRAVLGRSRIAKSREPGSATALARLMSARQRLTPLRIPNRLASRKFR